MSSTIVYQRSFFADLNGKALDNGAVYIGTANQDPQTNPIQCYWDAGLTTPATQPLAVSGGYIVNAGIRAAVYVAEDSFSLRARNSAGVQVDYVAESNDGALRGALAASSGSSLVGFIQSGSGAVATTVQAKLRETVSVTDFGAVGDGVADDTAAIQATITRVTAAGGIVHFPPGTYKILGTITIAAGKITLQGSGRDATNLLFANGSSDCIVMNSGTTQLYRSNIYDLTVTGSSKTGGRALYMAYFANCNIERVDFQSIYTGLDIYVTNTITLRDVLINNISYASGYGIYWHAPSDGSARSDVLNCQNVTIQANYSGADGVIWDGLSQTMNWLHGGILNTKRGLWIKNTGNAVQNTPGFLESFGMPIEGAQTGAVVIEGGYQFHFVDAVLTNMYGSNGNADEYAVKILADATHSITNSIKFDSCRIGLCAKSAVWCAARSVQFTDCTFPGAGLLTANTYPGVQLASPGQQIIIDACIDSEWGSTNQTSYSVQIDSGVSGVSGSNYYYAGVTGAVLNNSSDTRISLGGISLSTEYPIPVNLGAPQANGTGAGATLTAAQVLSPILLRSGPGGNFTDTMPTAAQIITQMSTPMVNGVFEITIANLTAFQQTIQVGAGVTFAGNVSGGNFVLAANVTRRLILQVTACAAGAEAVTVYG